MKDPDFINFILSEDFSSFIHLLSMLKYLRSSYCVFASYTFSAELDMGNIPSEDSIIAFNQDFERTILDQELLDRMIGELDVQKLPIKHENIENLLTNENFLKIIIPSVKDVQRSFLEYDIEFFGISAEDLQQTVFQYDIFVHSYLKSRELTHFTEFLPLINQELFIDVWSGDLKQLWLRRDLQVFTLGGDLRATLEAW